MSFNSGVIELVISNRPYATRSPDFSLNCTPPSPLLFDVKKKITKIIFFSGLRSKSKHRANILSVSFLSHFCLNFSSDPWRKNQFSTSLGVSEKLSLLHVSRGSNQPIEIFVNVWKSHRKNLCKSASCEGHRQGLSSFLRRWESER